MSKAASPPQAPEDPAALTRVEPDALNHDEWLAEVHITASSLRDQHARGVTIRESALERVELTGSRLDDLKLLDVTFANCDLAAVRAARAAITRVSLDGCRLTGLLVADGVLRDVTFRDSRIDLASFSACRLERVGFADCMLAESDFIDARLEDVRFERCALTNVDFTGVRIRRCELRGCDLTHARGVASLRGAAVPWQDIVATAGTWAAALGIEPLED